MPAYNFNAGETGLIELDVVGHPDDPSDDWSAFTRDMLVFSADDNSLVETVSGFTAPTGTANADDATLFDFTLSATLPATLAAGFYYVQFRVKNGSTIVDVLPTLKYRLVLRVWEAPA